MNSLKLKEVPSLINISNMIKLERCSDPRGTSCMVKAKKSITEENLKPVKLGGEHWLVYSILNNKPHISLIKIGSYDEVLLFQDKIYKWFRLICRLGKSEIIEKVWVDEFNPIMNYLFNEDYPEYPLPEEETVEMSSEIRKMSEAMSFFTYIDDTGDESIIYDFKDGKLTKHRVGYIWPESIVAAPFFLIDYAFENFQVEVEFKGRRLIIVSGRATCKQMVGAIIRDYCEKNPLNGWLRPPCGKRRYKTAVDKFNVEFEKHMNNLQGITKSAVSAVVKLPILPAHEASKLMKVPKLDEIAEKYKLNPEQEKMIYEDVMSKKREEKDSGFVRDDFEFVGVVEEYTSDDEREDLRVEIEHRMYEEKGIHSVTVLKRAKEERKRLFQERKLQRKRVLLAMKKRAKTLDFNNSYNLAIRLNFKGMLGKKGKFRDTRWGQSNVVPGVKRKWKIYELAASFDRFGNHRTRVGNVGTPFYKRPSADREGILMKRRRMFKTKLKKDTFPMSHPTDTVDIYGLGYFLRMMAVYYFGANPLTGGGIRKALYIFGKQWSLKVWGMSKKERKLMNELIRSIVF